MAAMPATHCFGREQVFVGPVAIWTFETIGPPFGKQELQTAFFIVKKPSELIKSFRKALSGMRYGLHGFSSNKMTYPLQFELLHIWCH
jgi:hypothetical protein